MKYNDNCTKPPQTNSKEGAPKYDIDFAALGEVKLVVSGSIKEETGYTYWSGKTSINKSESGVAYVVKNLTLIPNQ